LESSFAPTTTLATSANLFVAGMKPGIATVADLIEKARAAKLTYGSPGIGSQLHLAMELFKQKAGVEITHVPYRGMPPAVTDLLGGHIDILISNLPVALAIV